MLWPEYPTRDSSSLRASQRLVAGAECPVQGITGTTAGLRYKMAVEVNGGVSHTPMTAFRQPTLKSPDPGWPTGSIARAQLGYRRRRPTSREGGSAATCRRGDPVSRSTALPQRSSHQVPANDRPCQHLVAGQKACWQIVPETPTSLCADPSRHERWRDGDGSRTMAQPSVIGRLIPDAWQPDSHLPTC